MIRHLLTAFLLLACFAVYYAQELRYDAKLSGIAAANANALKQAHERTQAKQQEIANLDEAYTQQLIQNRATVERMRANPERVRVRANCPAMPAVADSAGVGDGPSARPTDAAIRNYLLLTERHGTVTAQLGACQDILRLLK
jgi:prophage endopeptidase